MRANYNPYRKIKEYFPEISTSKWASKLFPLTFLKYTKSVFVDRGHYFMQL